MVDVIPEARLNLVIYYLKQDDVKAASDLIKDLEPAVPQEYILKGIVNAVMGQETNSVCVFESLLNLAAINYMETYRQDFFSATA